MAQPTPYIGSKISLISKLDIRYEGILYTVDSKESTIALSKVRSFGTEDRNAAHVVPPQDDVYDYIIFKANDIKDLIVCETPKPPAAPGLPYDPAILSVSQKPSAAAAPPAPVGSERRSGSENATRTSSSPTTTTNAPSQQQQQPQQSWKNNDNKANNSNYRQGGGHQNRQHGYEGNNKPQQPRNYESQNRNDNYRQGNNQQNNRNYDSQNRNNSYNQNQNNRGGPRNQNSRGNGPRPHGPRNNLKFENDYDFEKAYEQFKETLEAIVGDVQNVKIDDSQENDESSVKSGGGNDETFYDKNKSFFDSISCEALEKEEGKNTRPDWKKERLTNQETFGQQSVRSFGYRRGGFNNRGGGYNNRGGGGYGNRQQGYDNNRRQSGSYDNNRRGGGGGYTRGGGYDNNRGRGGQQGRDNNSSRQQGENKHN